jgi:hypothetical protein
MTEHRLTEWRHVCTQVQMSRERARLELLTQQKESLKRALVKSKGGSRY